jgi:hypothetical protein
MPSRFAGIRGIFQTSPKERDGGMKALKKIVKGLFAKMGYLVFPKPACGEYHLVPNIYGRAHRKMRDIMEDAIFRDAADKVMASRRSCMYYDRMHTLYQAVVNAKARAKGGRAVNILEVGVYRGGGSHFLGSVAAALCGGKCAVYSVDTFEGHHADDLAAGQEGIQTVGSFSDTSYEDVSAYLRAVPCVQVRKGRIQDVAPSLAGVAFDVIHLDVDIYEPTLFVLREIAVGMSPGGIVVLDDYGYTTTPRVRTAVADFLAGRTDFVLFEAQTGQGLLVKVGV